MKSMRWAILAIVLFAAFAFMIRADEEGVFQFYTLPTNTPVINFQGRVEVEAIGYTGTGYFKLAIGEEDFEEPIWESEAEVECVEGIFNILIGYNTDDELPGDELFTIKAPVFLRIEFSTDGEIYELMEPDQQFVSVPYAFNAYLLDGLHRPESAIVGVTDEQTLESKTLVEPLVENYIFFTGTPPTPDFGEQTGLMSYNFEAGRPQFWDGEKWVWWADPEDVEGVTGTGVPQQVTFWAEYEGRTGVRGHPGFTFDTRVTGGLYLGPEITTGTILKIEGDDLTGTGRALTVASSGDPDGAMVTFDRASDGPALSVFADNLEGPGALFSSPSATSGQAVKIHSDTASLTGELLFIHQDHASATGAGLRILQAGPGAGARIDLSAGPASGEPALFVSSLRDTTLGISDTEGGTVHIYSQNRYGALTVLSDEIGLAQEAPLVTFRTTESEFSHPLLSIEPADESEGVHLYLKPIPIDPTVEEEKMGLIYMGEDGHLYFHDGTVWVRLPGEGDGDITGEGVAERLTIWTGEKTIGSQAGLTFSEGVLTATEIALGLGATIDEFSIDDELGGATPSDGKVPTQAAVKAYVDDKIGYPVPESQLDHVLRGGADDWEATDSMVITGAGDVGIGTTEPTEKLHIAGSIRIVDGTEGSGLVLTSDAQGVGSWTAVTAIAGDVSGGGEAGQVTYWAGDQIVTGDDGFTYVEGTETLNVTNIGAFSLAGALTGGAHEISGTNFNIGGGIGAFSDLTTATFAVTAGDPAEGKVLTAVDDSGTVTWAAPAEGDVTGSGTEGTIPIWDDETELGDSIITQTLDPDTITVGGALIATTFETSDEESATISTFSTDTDLGGEEASDEAVSTQKAVKDYVDARMPGWEESFEHWVIRGGDEGWEATDFMVIDTTYEGVGINLGAEESPTAVLDVLGSIRFRTGASDGHILVSDEFGYASWTELTLPEGEVTGTGTAGIIARWAGEQEIEDSSILDDGETVTVQADLVAESLTAGDLDDGSVVFAGTDGLLETDAGFTFDGSILNVPQIELGLGETIDEFSADVTLGGVGASDEKVPTQFAVKEYVDARVPDDMPESVQDWVIRGEAGHWTATGVMTIDANEQVAISSGVTTGRALDVVANSLTSGNALRVFSDTTAGTADAMVYLERTGVGRALQVRSGVEGASGVWIDSNTVTGGNVMMVKGNSPGMLAGGNILQVHQDHSDGLGRGLFVRQDGIGQAARFTLSEREESGGSAIWVQTGRSTHSGVSASEGGAVHINNAGNIHGGLTVYSSQEEPGSPLSTFRVTSGFNQPILRLRQPTEGVAPHLWLTPIEDENIAPADPAAGMIYASSDQNTLVYYTGEEWIPLGGGITGSGARGQIAYWDTSNTLTGDASFYWDTDNNRLGIRTAVPHTGLTIRAPDSSQEAVISAFTRSTTVGDYTGIRFRASNETTDPRHYGGAVYFERTGAAGRGSLHLATKAGGTDHTVSLADSRMTITSDGDVGINVTEPTTRLDVDGQIRIRGGTPGEGRVLTSDEDGLASWVLPTEGDVEGAGTAGRVAIWTDTKEIGDDEDFTYAGGTLSVPTLSADTIDAFTLGGTMDADSQDIENVAILSGTIDGTDIGETTPAAGTFTSLIADDLTLGEGVEITEFSDDDTLGGETPSHEVVSTQKAVKDYVDGLVPDAMPEAIEHWVIRGTGDGWEATDAMIISSYGGGNVGIGPLGHTSPHSRLEVFIADDEPGTHRAMRIQNMRDVTGRGGSGLLVRAFNQEEGTNVAHFMSGPAEGEDSKSVMMVRADGRVGINNNNPFEQLSLSGRMWMQQTEAPEVTTDRLYNVDGDLHWDGKVLDGRWTYRTGTRVNNDTFEPDNSDAFQPGTPIRYSSDGSDWSYGMVVANGGATVTLAGAPMGPGMDAFVQTGKPELLRQVNFYKPGEVEAINDYMGLATWQMPQGYVVRVTGQLESAGDDDVKIQVKIAGNGLIDGTLDLSDTSEWDSNTSINTTHYNIGFGSRIEVDLEDDGGPSPGAGLLVTMQVITP